jgi:hypothetical protein
MKRTCIQALSYKLRITHRLLVPLSMPCSFARRTFASGGNLSFSSIQKKKKKKNPQLHSARPIGELQLRSLGD